MRIKTLRISNFKSIRSFTLNDVESALILVGKNSVGKTVVTVSLEIKERRRLTFGEPDDILSYYTQG